jgi:RhoGEF domain
MRFKIINEIVQTENTFLQDMNVLEDGYNAFVYECPFITTRQKQTMFGRTKYVISFSNGFYKGLFEAAGNYVYRTEDEIMNAKFDDLVEWDSETSVGEAFWSSVTAIEIGLIVDGED